MDGSKGPMSIGEELHFSYETSKYTSNEFSILTSSINMSNNDENKKKNDEIYWRDRGWWSQEKGGSYEETESCGGKRV